MAEGSTDEHGRPLPPLAGGEVATLLGFLEYQRATLAWKCAGLTDDQLRVALSPSPIPLGGLLKHLAQVEDEWFTEAVGGEPTAEPWAGVDRAADPGWEWRSAADDSGDELRALWSERVQRARTVVGGRLRDGGAAALDDTHPAWLGRVSLRWVLSHMTEEYARHNGQADLIRESIDGQTGE
ncbi:Protein of unknown function [Modestobacter sp. DSM 44400]|uniref:DinB family protein n=1 Tax=Modestobacter sp. DSM 44400 TaxID=1550230 RepID=UPI00089D892B|nr:DinB family protein [Modestobacter sp. DSM 44400]SDX59218.1 Protein of unknown function [Modestobacter sp. DSM 44400]